MRLDVWLTEQQLLPSRARAQAAIDAGLVQVNGTVVTRRSHAVSPTDQVKVTADPVGYVGRGGLKLAAALAYFRVDPAGRDCLDIGASTGGFTDCLLQRRASRIAAIDVGTAQLHPSLASHPSVWSLAQTDVRSLTGDTFLSRWGRLPDLAVIDVSFISLEHVLPAVSRLVAPRGELLALVKPQFELGPGRVGKGGIVRDQAKREEAVGRVLGVATALGLGSSPAWPCPVTGGDGNQEYFLHLRQPEYIPQPERG